MGPVILVALTMHLTWISTTCNDMLLIDLGFFLWIIACYSESLHVFWDETQDFLLNRTCVDSVFLVYTHCWCLFWWLHHSLCQRFCEPQLPYVDAAATFYYQGTDADTHLGHACHTKDFLWYFFNHLTHAANDDGLQRCTPRTEQ